MKHVVMTRSAYGPAWDEGANARRLDITKGVTVASMAAQTSKDWVWIVAIDRNDPLKAERKAAFQSAGVPVRFVFIETTTTDRQAAAVEAYKAPWAKAIGKRDQVTAMTRLDDDDALAPWVIGRLQTAIPTKLLRTTILVLPIGIRVWGGRQTIVNHGSNAMQTLVTLPGSDLHVYSYKHREARRVGKVRALDGRLAWVWTRHPDTISGWHTAEKDIPERMRGQFPIDWSLIEQHRPNGKGMPRGRAFR